MWTVFKELAHYCNSLPRFDFVFLKPTRLHIKDMVNLF